MDSFAGPTAAEDCAKAGCYALTSRQARGFFQGCGYDLRWHRTWQSGYQANRDLTPRNEAVGLDFAYQADSNRTATIRFHHVLVPCVLTLRPRVASLPTFFADEMSAFDLTLWILLALD